MDEYEGGFFRPSELISKAPISRIPKCGSCKLHKSCLSPKMKVSGKGERKILLIGEAPGEKEDKEGKQFVGKIGQLLRQTLSKFGIDMRRDCWLTNALICRPPHNETPTPKQIDYCRPNLINAIELLKPEIIVPIGGPAVDSLISYLWKEKVGPISRWVGWQIPCQKPNAWIMPIWHPSYVSRTYDRDTGRCRQPEIPLIWSEHIQAISRLEGRPWEKLPNWKSQIKKILDPTDAAKYVREIIQRGGRAAYDYETTMLKPEFIGARIVSCSICWEGKETIAYPFYGEAVEATKEFLRSDILKIAANLKFEDRWSMRILKTRVRNWHWCTVNNAHIMDCRRESTSLKFQAFVLLGQESYNDPVEQFLRSKGDSRINQILKEIDIQQLLQYNGMDSLLEFHVCLEQQRRLNYV